jgi:hypothetical protein
VTGFHVLRVHGYSLLSEVFGKDKSIKSPAFDIGGHSWSLKLCPNSDSGDDDYNEGDSGEGDGEDSESCSDDNEDSSKSARHVGLYLHLNSVSDGESVVYARPRCFAVQLIRYSFINEFNFDYYSVVFCIIMCKVAIVYLCSLKSHGIDCSY